MRILLKLLEFSLIIVATQFIGTWVRRRLKPRQDTVVMVSIAGIMGLASVGKALFEFRKNPSDLVPFFAYVGFALLWFGMGTGHLFLKHQPLASSERQ